MALEDQVADLVTQTTNLLDSVTASKTALQNAATSAAADAATASTAATATAQDRVAAQAAQTASESARDSAVAVVTGGTASLVAAAGKIPLADGAGRLDVSWYNALSQIKINDIGRPGAPGYGVGICPAVPSGFTPLPGVTDPLSANYGNYQFSDGSVMCWIPAFWTRWGHVNNPTYSKYGVNSVDTQPLSAFPDEPTANAQGYYMSPAFFNAGAQQAGIFRDKYDCSLNGAIASSIQGVQPLVSGPVEGQTGFAQCTANGQAPSNIHAGAIDAARSRGSKFFPETVALASALATIAMAHAQAATSATYCAWYDAAGVNNFPKGNNNNALGDMNDAGVHFTSAGNETDPLFALAGSGTPFAKTTHNGQACGVSDINGSLWRINLGVTSIGVDKAITGVTQTNPVVVTAVGHGRATGDVVFIDGLVGATEINSCAYQVTVVDVDHISLNGVDGTAFSTYTSAGTVHHADFYALKRAVDITQITSGASLATDHWGSAGIAANFDPITLNFHTDYPNNQQDQRYGNGASAVFSMAAQEDVRRTLLGFPAALGSSSNGTNQMGGDGYYGRMINQLCVLSGADWVGSSKAGVWARFLNNARSYGGDYVGFAASRFL